MKKAVYNVGLPRTATRSMVNLFEQMGFITKHAMLTPDYNFEIGFVLNNLDQFKKPNTFYSDTPIWNPAFWEIANLKDQFVIHTYRDKESWINSIMNFSHFKQCFENDVFWYAGILDKIDTDTLSRVYDDHLKLSKDYFKNILSINITNDQPDQIIDKICSNLEIENLPHYKLEVIGKNPYKQPIAN